MTAWGSTYRYRGASKDSVHLRLPGWPKAACGHNVRTLDEEWNMSSYPAFVTCERCRKVAGWRGRG